MVISGSVPATQILGRLSGQLSVLSKLVICVMMIRDRHRGLLYEVDRAIQMPNERLVDDNDEPYGSGIPFLVHEV